MRAYEIYYLPDMIPNGEYCGHATPPCGIVLKVLILNVNTFIADVICRPFESIFLFLDIGYYNRVKNFTRPNSCFNHFDVQVMPIVW